MAAGAAVLLTCLQGSTQASGGAEPLQPGGPSLPSFGPSWPKGIGPNLLQQFWPGQRAVVRTRGRRAAIPQMRPRNIKGTVRQEREDDGILSSYAEQAVRVSPFQREHALGALPSERVKPACTGPLWDQGRGLPPPQTQCLE
jgi:hypothetical protein